MRFMTCAVAVMFVAAGSAGDAFADAAEGQSYFSVMGTYVDDDDDRDIGDGLNGGQFGFGYGLNDDWNIEALFQASRCFVRDAANMRAGLAAA